jgi:DNA polymerase-4
VWLMPGIERDDLIRLREFNFIRIAEVAALSLQQLEIMFGKRAEFLHSAIRGIDTSPVLPVVQNQPEISLDHAFGNDTNDLAKIEGTLYTLVEQSGLALRRQQRAARRICIVLDYSDGMRCVRQTAVKPATANDLTLFEQAKRTLNLAWTRRVRIRHMRLVCDRLVFPPAQMPIFAADRKENEKRENLVAAMDRIRGRFGHDAIQVGRCLAA